MNNLLHRPVARLPRKGLGGWVVVLPLLGCMCWSCIVQAQETGQKDATPKVTPQELKALRDAFQQSPKPRPTSRPAARTVPARRAAAPSLRPGPTPSSKESELDALRKAFANPSASDRPQASGKDPNGAAKRGDPSADSSSNGQKDDDSDLTAPPSSSTTSNTSNPVQQFLNAMNPAISALGIFAAGWTSVASGHCHADGSCVGPVGIFGHTHDPRRTGLNLQQLEFVFEAAVDPYFTAMIVLSVGEGESGAELEIEEAYMQTTALPGRFQVKLGKFLSDSTRLGSQHLHNLDFVTVALPLVLAVGGEMSHYAIQATWLAPLPFYLRLGAEVSYGGSTTFPIADPAVPVLVGHLRMYFDLSPSLRLLFGGGVSHGVWDRALADASELTRTIANGHILFQWRPPERNNSLMFKVLAEYYGAWNQCDPRKTNSTVPQFRQYCVGTDPNQVALQSLHGFVVETVLRFAQQWQTGLRFEWMQQREPSASRPTHRVSGMLVFVPTEFSRIRLQYDGSNLFDGAIENAHAVWLQAQFSIGAHGAHSF